jgi:hypothetical protein
MAWKSELNEGSRIEERTDGTTAVGVFVADAAGDWDNASVLGVPPVAIGDAYPGRADLKCRSYQMALVANRSISLTAQYATETEKERSGASAEIGYIRESIKWSADYIVWGTGGQWETGEAVVEWAERYQKRVETLVYVFEVTYGELPASLIADAVGKINSATWRGWVAETALCSSPSAEKFFTDDGSERWAVTYEFQIRQIDDGGTIRGWNYDWNPNRTGGAGFQRIKDRHGDYKYETFNFNTLIPS